MTARQLVVRPKDVDRTLHWYDGENAVEVAQALGATAKESVSVSFSTYSSTLRIAGRMVDRRVWIADDGEIFTEDQLDELFDVVESRGA